MTNKEAIYALKTRTCYECSYGCESPVLCSCPDCDLKESTILATEALERAEWIPASERLPEDGRMVLVTRKSLLNAFYLIDLAFFNSEECIWENRDLYDLDVIAWMELPKIYENEVKE